MLTDTTANPRVLTDEHRDFATNHHDEVVYGFLGSRKLSRDQYYDVVILKYLYAVQIYSDRSELQKYSFKTIAYRAMTSALNSYWRKMGRPKYSTPVLSLNSMYDHGFEEKLSMSEYPEIHSHIEAAQDWQQIKRTLTAKELEVLQKRAEGYTYRELARDTGITYSGVSSRFYRMRKKARACLAAIAV